jgi:hypothetical protein
MEEPIVVVVAKVKTIKKIRPWSVFKVVYILDLLFIAAIIAPMTWLWSLATIPSFMLPDVAVNGIRYVPYFLLIVHPIAMAVAAVIATVIYNMMSSIVGGIKIEIE